MSEDESVLRRSAGAPDQLIAYGPDPAQVVEVRYGRDGAARPLVIFIHGGFWRPDIDRTHARPLAEALAAEGWTVALPEYARVAHDPAPTLSDVTRMLTQAQSWRVPHIGRVVLAGHSAGGHLALWAAAARLCPVLIGALALAPVADLVLAHRLNLGNGAVERFVGADPATRPDIDPARMPGPTVATTLMHGLDDSVVPPSVSESYQAIHTATRLTAIAQAGHFALIDPLAPSWTRVVAELGRWVS